MAFQVEKRTPGSTQVALDMAGTSKDLKGKFNNAPVGSVNAGAQPRQPAQTAGKSLCARVVSISFKVGKSLLKAMAVATLAGGVVHVASSHLGSILGWLSHYLPIGKSYGAQEAVKHGATAGVTVLATDLSSQFGNVQNQGVSAAELKTLHEQNYQKVKVELQNELRDQVVTAAREEVAAAAKKRTAVGGSRSSRLNIVSSNADEYD